LAESVPPATQWLRLAQRRLRSRGSAAAEVSSECQRTVGCQPKEKGIAAASEGWLRRTSGADSGGRCVAGYICVPRRVGSDGSRTIRACPAEVRCVLDGARARVDAEDERLHVLAAADGQ
jgi:hypothetical protein